MEIRPNDVETDEYIYIGQPVIKDRQLESESVSYGCALFLWR